MDLTISRNRQAAVGMLDAIFVVLLLIVVFDYSAMGPAGPVYVIVLVVDLIISLLVVTGYGKTYGSKRKLWGNKKEEDKEFSPDARD